MQLQEFRMKHLQQRAGLFERRDDGGVALVQDR